MWRLTILTMLSKYLFVMTGGATQPSSLCCRKSVFTAIVSSSAEVF